MEIEEVINEEPVQYAQAHTRLRAKQPPKIGSSKSRLGQETRRISDDSSDSSPKVLDDDDDVEMD